MRSRTRELSEGTPCAATQEDLSALQGSRTGIVLAARPCAARVHAQRAGGRCGPRRGGDLLVESAP